MTNANEFEKNVAYSATINLSNQPTPQVCKTCLICSEPVPVNEDHIPQVIVCGKCISAIMKMRKIFEDDTAD